MAAKCLVCQSESPEGKKFCAECGAEFPQPEQTPEEQPIVAVSTAPKTTWCSTHLKGLFAVAIVLVVVLASIGLIYTQPLSKVKVLVANGYHDQVGVRVYIDDDLKADVGLSPGGYQIIGVWPVRSGIHEVSIDHGFWWLDEGYSSLDYDDTWNYSGPDGTNDFAYDYQVGPLYTKNAFISIG